MFNKLHRKRFSILILLFLSTGALGRQQEPAVKLESNLVLVDAVVLSRKNHAIIGDLKREDFSIRENGREQALTHFSREELPLSLVLLLDVSGSAQPVIDEIQRAALFALAQLKPKDKVAIMIFANKPRLVCELTSNRGEIDRKLDGVWSDSADIGYETFINLGVYEASRYLRKKTEPTERRAIVLVSGDVDTTNFRGGPPRDVVLKDLYEGGTTLCGIVAGYSRVARKAADIGSMAAITAVNPVFGATRILLKILDNASSASGSAGFYADRTGGIAVSPNYTEVAATFVEMLQLLRTRYTIGYAPEDVTPDDRFREIKLKIGDHIKKEKGSVRVFFRRGYYARKPIKLPYPIETSDPIEIKKCGSTGSP